MRFKLGVGMFAAFALSAWAHHSHGAYTETFMDIEGVVKEVHLVVPHSWVYLEVKGAKGEPEIWALEATGRTGLQRAGVTPDYVKPGDTVRVRCHRLKDGQFSRISFSTITPLYLGWRSFMQKSDCG